MRVYVAGARGMLGAAVVKQFEQEHVLATDIECDVRDFQKIKDRVACFRPDVIMNLAALTGLEQCEQCPEDAISTNGTANLAALAAGTDATYVFISSGEIFDGTREFDSDDDAANPQSVYGKTKQWGELIAQAVPKHYVMRAAWMMGGGPTRDKKFINQIYKQIRSGRTELVAVNDVTGTPTYTADLARQIAAVLKNAPYGIYNSVCGGSCTRYEMAVEFVRLLGAKVTVSPVSSEMFKCAVRQPRQCLRNDKLIALGLNVMRDWKTALAEYSREFV